MTANTQFKTLVREWLKAKKPMVAPSTHAAFTLIAENHLVPQFGGMKIASISEADVQSYILNLHEGINVFLKVRAAKREHEVYVSCCWSDR